MDLGHKSTFHAIKAALVSSEILAQYNPLLPTIVSADASSYGLGTVLTQQQPDSDVFRPVAYISRTLTTTEQRYAQIEKEALAVTWACERLQTYLLGIQFHIQTDHKSLVPLFSTKPLELLPIRVQHFRLRMMRFGFTISHVPGKEFYIADTLSRSPFSSVTVGDNQFEAEVGAYVNLLVQTLPATETRLQQIREAQLADHICSQVMEYCRHGWPHPSQIEGPIKKYVSVKDELSVCNNLLLRNSRLVIPTSLQDDVLKKLHTGHQGITKCRQRASQAVWWPGISKHIDEAVQRCSICCKTRFQPQNLCFRPPSLTIRGKELHQIFLNVRSRNTY